MIRPKSVFVNSALLLMTITTCIACNNANDSDGFSSLGTVLQDPPSSGANPVDAGVSFVFAVAELFSNDPVAIIETAIVWKGDTSRLDVLHQGSSIHPSANSDGLVTVTESCPTNGIEYRRISVLTADGGTSPLTPCSSDIDSPSGFTWIDHGKLSPNSQRLAAQLDSSGQPPITAVFENGQEIARYPGFGRPAWLDDETLVLVGSKLLTVRLGEQPTVINDEVILQSVGAVAVSPDKSQLVFEWERALWIMNVDGSGLRELLPANRYIFPAWSPDGQWVAAIQQETPSALEIQTAALTGFFAYTNLSTFTVVNVNSGEQFFEDISIHLTDSQMPQGGLSWK